MKKVLIAAILSASAMLLSACGEQVEVKPAQVGKVLTSSGVKPDLIPPSRFRLSSCLLPWSICDKLMTVDAADMAIAENMEVMMPADQLVLTFDLRGTVTLTPENAGVVFEKVTGEVQPGGHTHISLKRVYETYAQQRVRSVARAVVTKYTINQINENRNAIEAEIFSEIQKSLGETPVQAKFVGLADVQFPDVIVQAKIAAEQRKIDIEKESAAREIELQKKITEMKVAEADQAIRLLKAETIRKENDITAASVTPKYLSYRQLEVLETMANNPNTVFFPVEMLGNTQFTGSIANGMFNKQFIGPKQ